MQQQNNQGEGNKEAGQQYQRDTHEFVRQGKVPASAKIARDAVDDEEEGEELRSAEEEAKAVADYDDV